MAVPFHHAAGLEASGMLPKAPGGARSAAAYREHQVHVQSEANIQHEKCILT